MLQLHHGLVGKCDEWPLIASIFFLVLIYSVFHFGFRFHDLSCMYPIAMIGTLDFFGNTRDAHFCIKEE